MIGFLIGFIIGLAFINAAVFAVTEIKDRNDAKRYREWKERAKNNVLKDGSGRVIWREDIGCCGPATYC